MVAADVRRRRRVRFIEKTRLLTRLCENSEMAFWKNEKRVLGPLAAKENAPYRNCGGRFFRVAGWRGVFAQSVTSAVEWTPVEHLYWHFDALAPTPLTAIVRHQDILWLLK